MSDQHEALVSSMSQLLERSVSARIFIVAGMHTGRSVVSNFFRIAALYELIPDNDGIKEHNVVSGITRPWKDNRGAEDIVERKQWLIVAKLSWSQDVGEEQSVLLYLGLPSDYKG